jgi:hypothetical protein
MRTTIKTLLSTLLLLAPLLFSAEAFAAKDNAAQGSGNGKVTICHRTSSKKNPWVILEVSTSASQAHYDHGDPVQFTILSNGDCAPKPPSPLPTVSLNLAAAEIFVGATTNATWTSSNATTCTLGTTTVAVSGSTAVGPYSSVGNQTITITCTGAGGTVSDSEILKIKALVPTVSLSLLANEINVGATTTANWTSTSADTCTLGTTNVALNGSATVGSFSSPGDQTITITCVGAGGTVSDSEILKIKALVPTVSLSLIANEINVGATTTANWTSTSADTCTLGTTNVALNGSATVGPYSSAGDQTITITCVGAGGTVSDSEILKVNALPLPTVTLSLAASAIDVGTTTTAEWTSTNSTTCTLGTTSVALNGSATVGPYSSDGNQTITITCTGAGGTASDSETLVVNALEEPAVSLSLDDVEIYVNNGTTMAYWESELATSCTLNGNPVALNGETELGPYTALGNVTITVSCIGAGGTASESEILRVITAPAPTVTLNLALSSIEVNATTTATWSSTNTTSCTMGTNTLAVSGTTAVGPYSSAGPKTVTVSCLGYNGATVSASKTLTVTPPAAAPTVSLSLGAGQVTVNTGTTTATWNSTNATSCTMTSSYAPGSMSVGQSGSTNVGPYSSTGDVTITVSCSGVGGTSSDSETLQVVPVQTWAEVCLRGRFGSNTQNVFALEYDFEEQNFDGISPGEDVITGTVTPLLPGPVSGLFSAGTLVTFEIENEDGDTMTGVSLGGPFSIVGGASYFTVNLFTYNPLGLPIPVPLINGEPHIVWFESSCPELIILR